ncbi:MAG: (2Fe-2S) ferredoxin domain-containing protein, partial [Blautia sp.]|nr:(2Fe-2S) ferredoxin domain-containing protein [Blautia sp.]
MIHNMDELNATITSCTKCLDDKLTGADGKRHIVLCGGTGCLSNHSAEIREKFNKLIEEKGLADKVTVNQVG